MVAQIMGVACDKDLTVQIQNEVNRLVLLSTVQNLGLLDLLLWLLVLEVLSFAVLPYIAWMAPKAPDRGYGLSKVCGVFVFSGLCWLLTLWGLAGEGNSIIILTFVLLIFAGYIGYARGLISKRELRELLSRFAVPVEGVFLGLTLFFAIIRFFNPEIFWGEKPMDSTLLNFFVRNDHLPPQDPWAAGSSMSYYYLGIYFIAALLKLTGISVAVGYNLAISTIAGLIGSSLFGLLLLLTRAKSFAAYGAAFLVLASDPEVLRLVFVDGKKINFDTFWASTRVFTAPCFLEYTSWSLLFADLHAHVIAIPFAVTVLGLAALVFLDGASRYSLHGAFLRALLGGMVGALFGINTWDFITFGAVVGILVVTARIPLFWTPPNHTDGTKSLGEIALVTLFTRAVAFLWDALIIGVCAWLAVYLYRLGANFRPAGGWGWVYHPEFNSFLKLLRVLGYWMVGTLLSIAVIALLRTPKAKKFSVPNYLLAALLFMVTVLPLLLSISKGIGHQPWGTVLYCAIVVAGAYLALWARYDSDEKKLVCIFASFAAFLIVMLELFYLLDRMNTLFKGYMAVWILAGISTLICAYYAFQMLGLYGGRRVRRCATAVPAIFATLILLGTAFNITATVMLDRVPKRHYTLDGLAYLPEMYSDDAQAIAWLNKNVKGIAVIVEAQGDSYREFTRIAMHTGLPTVMGWEHHVRQRGLADVEVPVRKKAIRTIYTSEDLELTKGYLAQYGVDFVVIGAIERTSYRPLILSKFDEHPEIFTKVASFGKTDIYRTYLSKFNPSYMSGFNR